MPRAYTEEMVRDRALQRLETLEEVYQGAMPALNWDSLRNAPVDDVLATVEMLESLGALKRTEPTLRNALTRLRKKETPAKADPVESPEPEPASETTVEGPVEPIAESGPDVASEPVSKRDRDDEAQNILDEMPEGTRDTYDALESRMGDFLDEYDRAKLAQRLGEDPDPDLVEKEEARLRRSHELRIGQADMFGATAAEPGAMELPAPPVKPERTFAKEPETAAVAADVAAPEPEAAGFSPDEYHAARERLFSMQEDFSRALGLRGRELKEKMADFRAVYANADMDLIETSTATLSRLLDQERKKAAERNTSPQPGAAVVAQPEPEATAEPDAPDERRESPDASESETGELVEQVMAVKDDGQITPQEAEDTASAAGKVLQKAEEETPDPPSVTRTYENARELDALLEELCDDPEELAALRERVAQAQARSEQQARAKGEKPDEVPAEVRRVAGEILAAKEKNTPDEPKEKGGPRRVREEDAELLARAEEECDEDTPVEEQGQSDGQDGDGRKGKTPLPLRKPKARTNGDESKDRESEQEEEPVPELAKTPITPIEERCPEELENIRRELQREIAVADAAAETAERRRRVKGSKGSVGIVSPAPGPGRIGGKVKRTRYGGRTGADRFMRTRKVKSR